MKASTVILIVVVVLIAGGLIWWIYAMNSANQYATGPATYAPTSTSATGTASTTGATSGTGAGVVNISTSGSLGSYLTDASGMSLYRFTNDTPNSGKSTCYGQCAALWPPYTIADASVLSGISLAGITGNFGTITRTGGKLQVTYNGQPLYYYAKDSNPGDTNGQNIGGVWFVVTP